MVSSYMRSLTMMQTFDGSIFYLLFSIVASSSEEASSEFTQYIPDFIKKYIQVPHNELLYGVVSASLFMLFFALCPIIFRSIAYFGSNATSAMKAEKWALSAYWWFMALTAFSGSSILNMVLAGIEAETLDDTSVTKVMNEISAELAKGVAPSWIYWIILRTTIVLPANYLLQVKYLESFSLNFQNAID